MDAKVLNMDNTRLGFVIEDWLEETALYGVYKIDNATDYQLMVDDYRYECTSTTRKVQRKLTRFFDKIEIQVQINNNQNVLYVTIL